MVAEGLQAPRDTQVSETESKGSDRLAAEKALARLGEMEGYRHEGCGWGGMQHGQQRLVAPLCRLHPYQCSRQLTWGVIQTHPH